MFFSTASEPFQTLLQNKAVRDSEPGASVLSCKRHAGFFITDTTLRDSAVHVSLFHPSFVSVCICLSLSFTFIPPSLNGSSLQFISLCMLSPSLSLSDDYFSLSGSLQRFCLLKKEYMESFEAIFQEQYETIHRLETNKLRNVARMFAHLLYTDSVPWSVSGVFS